MANDVLVLLQENFAVERGCFRSAELHILATRLRKSRIDATHDRLPWVPLESVLTPMGLYNSWQTNSMSGRCSD